MTIASTGTGAHNVVGSKPSSNVAVGGRSWSEHFHCSRLQWRPCSGPQALPGEPLVRESRDGDVSVFRITSADGGEKIYRIDLSHHHSPAYRRGPNLLKKWESYRLGAFVCFNTNQFTGQELCKTRDPKIYNPQQLDVAGWVAAFKEAGMKYAVLTTRHTSGFLLWDSATTDFDVASSGNTTDVCKEFVKECRRQGLSRRSTTASGAERWNPDPNARAIILAQLYELATQYGEIPYFWIDMKNWAPADLSTQEIYDCLKTLQPNCVVEVQPARPRRHEDRLLSHGCR